MVQATVASTAEACAKAEQLLSTAAPFDLGGETVVVTASIGLVVSEDGAQHPRANCSGALTSRSTRPRGKAADDTSCSTVAMDDAVRRRRLIERDLRAALETGTGLLLHYQPQFGPDGAKIAGVEALVRWMHPTRGLYPDVHQRRGRARPDRPISAAGHPQGVRDAADTSIPAHHVNVSPIQSGGQFR